MTTKKKSVRKSPSKSRNTDAEEKKHKLGNAELEVNSMAESDALRIELINLKEQVSDLLDRYSPGQQTKPSNLRSAATTRATNRAKLAIVVGHSKLSDGGMGLPPVDPSEYPWNSDLAKKIKESGAASGIEVQVFYRDGVGITGAYQNVAKWEPAAVIELHYNNDGGKARGTETLWGPACAASEGWAKEVHAAMVKLYGRKNSLNRGTKKTPPHPRGSASVNALSAIPSCLIEPFFGDNAEDARLGGQKKQALADALVGAFGNHFGVARGGGPQARGLGGQAVASSTSTASHYTPPASAAKFIGKIDLTPAKPFVNGEQIKGLTHVRILSQGTIFFDTDLATDADGSPRAKIIDPGSGQLETAYNFSGQTGQARYPDAEKISYIVLAGSNTPSPRPKEEYLYRRLGLRLGDIAAVIWKDRIEFAMFADASANDNMGEGSIALVEALGYNPWNDAKTRIVRGIPGPGVLTFVFPNSKISGITPQNAAKKIREAGESLFKGIGGRLN